MDKTNVLGSLLFGSKRQDIFRFKQRVITGPYMVLVTHMPTGMCDVTSGSKQMTVLVPSHLHLLIMGPGENYLPSPRHCIFINIT